MEPARSLMTAYLRQSVAGTQTAVDTQKRAITESERPSKKPEQEKVEPVIYNSQGRLDTTA